jgi:hypothetical protein
MADPTAGDPGAGKSDPPGDAQQFPFNYAYSNLYDPNQGSLIQISYILWSVLYAQI